MWYTSRNIWPFSKRYENIRTVRMRSVPDAQRLNSVLLSTILCTLHSNNLIWPDARFQQQISWILKLQTQQSFGARNRFRWRETGFSPVYADSIFITTTNYSAPLTSVRVSFLLNFGLSTAALHYFNTVNVTEKWPCRRHETLIE